MSRFILESSISAWAEDREFLNFSTRISCLLSGIVPAIPFKAEIMAAMSSEVRTLLSRRYPSAIPIPPCAP